MTNYTISNPALNPKRVFILQKSEVENRYDPSWYVYLQSMQGFKHKKVALKNLLLNNPQYGANEIGINRETNNEPRYIRITDINEFGELENVLGKTASTIEEKYFLQENDLLLARSGNTVGKSYLHKNKGYDCFFAGYMIRFKIDETKVLPKYIFAYTQTELYKKWVKAIQRTTGQPNINAEEYRNLEIPLPDKNIQEKVIETYFDFISQKQTNEAEAEKLLASIDDYLLKELGITLPKQTYYLQEEDFNIVREPETYYGNYRFVKEKFELDQQSKLVKQNRIFLTNFSEVSGSRFDPDYHKLYYKEFYNNLKKGKFNLLKAKKIITKIYTGKGLYEYLPNGIPYLNVNNIKKYEVVFDNVNYLEKENQYENIISKNQIITGRVGTIGNFAKYDKEFEALISDNVFALSFNEMILNVDFANYFLNSILSFTQLKRNSKGAVQEVISTNVLNELEIPVPPLAQQKEIANHITNIRNQAQALKDQTKDLLKKASEEIEEILLN